MNIMQIANDPIEAVMMDGVDPEAATDVAQLHAAVCRAIMCKFKFCEGNVLDTRTASLITEGEAFIAVACPTCAAEIHTIPEAEGLSIRTATQILEV